MGYINNYMCWIRRYVPITPIGRILACLCALFGAATMEMLVSVLVDRYQRVYNRKKFFSQQELFEQSPTQNILLKKFYRSKKDVNIKF